MKRTNKKKASQDNDKIKKNNLVKIGNSHLVENKQKYNISKKMIFYTGSALEKKKFEYISKLLAKYRLFCNSLIDIGCSDGYIPLIASRLGYKRIYALDNDNKCIELINQLKKIYKIESIDSSVYSFGDSYLSADIVIFTGMLHFIYNYGDLYGNFENMISYIRSVTIRYLLIEWIDPLDEEFLGIKQKKRIKKEKYNKENFLNILNKYFISVRKIYNTSNTRELYLCVV